MDSTTVMEINLENYQFPFPVRFVQLIIQPEQLQMDYTGQGLSTLINLLMRFPHF